jgi:hypothetical protein
MTWFDDTRYDKMRLADYDWHGRGVAAAKIRTDLYYSERTHAITPAALYLCWRMIVSSCDFGMAPLSKRTSSRWRSLA